MAQTEAVGEAVWQLVGDVETVMVTVGHVDIELLADAVLEVVPEVHVERE